MSTLTDREMTLVALGAAVASNCVPCVEYHVPVAKKAGLGDRQIDEALRIADKVRRVPARAVLEAARARIETARKEPAAAAAPACGCGGSSGPSRVGEVS